MIKYKNQGDIKMTKVNNNKNALININLTEVPLGEALIRVEREVYRFAMEAARWNQSRAARTLGVSRGTMRTKLGEYFPGVYL